MSLFTR